VESTHRTAGVTGAVTLPADPVGEYLARIGYAGERQPTVATLRALHEAHVAHIPFENIDVLLGRGVDLDPGALQQKLVRDRRGGYCFEHNLLFGSMLQALGFDVTYLSARVRFGAVGIRPRTHMLLLVRFADGRWIADVGFGSDGLLWPLPFDAGVESAQFRRTYRIVPQDGWWVMQVERAGEWTDLYTFTLDAHERVDYEVLNHYTATHPRSIFRSLLLAQMTSPERRVLLRNRELSVETSVGITTRTLTDEEVPQVLRETFGLQLPAGTMLPALD
jgi:N-hydroxyarylamine O-acetyltransferase